MDTLLTIIGWGSGIFLLLLLFAFAAGGSAQTGDTGLTIVVFLVGIGILWLIWRGGASLYDKISDTAESPKASSRQLSSPNVPDRPPRMLSGQ